MGSQCLRPRRECIDVNGYISHGLDEELAMKMSDQLASNIFVISLSQQ
jgi:hypothetical protein